MKAFFITLIFIILIYSSGNTNDKLAKHKIDSLSSRFCKQADDKNMEVVQGIIQLKTIQDTLDKFNEILELYNKAIDKDSMNTFAFSNKISFLIQFKHYSDAFNCLDTVIIRFSNLRSHFLFLQSLIAVKIGNTDRAISNVKKIIQICDSVLIINNDNLDAQAEKIQMECFINNDIKGAVKKLKKLQKKLPEGHVINMLLEQPNLLNREELANEIIR